MAVYLTAEAQNFARQAASNWVVSYGPIVQENGHFEMTFKNEIRYGPGGIGKETWWVDVNGELSTGAFSVRGRGSTAVSWINWYEGGIRNRVNVWIARWRELGQGASGSSIPIGPIVLNMNYSGAVSIRLYHPQRPGAVFANWNIPNQGTGNLLYNNRPTVIGGDWGIQIIFGNGVTSPIRRVDRIGTYQNGNWNVVATRIYNG